MKSHMFSLAVVAVLMAMRLQGASVSVLSTQKDTKDSDPKSAARNRSDITAFWGLSNVLGGAKEYESASAEEALKYLRPYAEREGNLYRAAFLVSIRKRSDLIFELAGSRSKKDTALAAAAMAMGVIGDFVQKERSDERIFVDHFGADGLKIEVRGGDEGEDVPQGKGKGKGGYRNRHNLSFKEMVDLTALGKLLASDDPLTLYLAVQAAAYAREKSVKETIAALEDSDGKIASAKLFYKAMIREALTREEILAAANLCARSKSKMSLGQKGVTTGPGFDLDIPGLCYVCRAIGVAEFKEAVPVLNKCLEGEPEVQVDAAWAMARVRSEECLPALGKAVSEAPWNVLVPVCKAVGLVPSGKMIPGLIERLSREKGRVRLELTHALCVIAGGQKGRTADEWKKWWMENKNIFTVDPEASKSYREKTRPQDVDIPANGVFYNLKIFSDHFSYVVDSSLSMKGDRIASLKMNLTKSVLGLQEFCFYNIVDFGGDVEAMDDELTNVKRKGEQRVYDMDMSLATRSFCALRASLTVPGVDSLYFLSDGAPAWDSMKNWKDIARGIAMLTRYYPVAVYCIDFDPTKGNQLFMIDLADENYGMHESIVVEAAPEDFDMGGAKGKKKR